MLESRPSVGNGEGRGARGEQAVTNLARCCPVAPYRNCHTRGRFFYSFDTLSLYVQVTDASMMPRKCKYE
jgi:hypothetical protein